MPGRPDSISCIFPAMSPSILDALASGQPRLSGMGLLEWYEIWNEQNAWWAGRAACFSPYEYAAMPSADYDGHKGRSAAAAPGIKAASLISLAKMIRTEPSRVWSPRMNGFSSTWERGPYW